MRIYIHAAKYSLFGLYNVTCMLAFRANHFILDTQLVCVFLGKTIL